MAWFFEAFQKPRSPFVPPEIFHKGDRCHSQGVLPSMAKKGRAFSPLSYREARLVEWIPWSSSTNKNGESLSVDIMGMVKHIWDVFSELMPKTSSSGSTSCFCFFFLFAVTHLFQIKEVDIVQYVLLNFS